MTAQVLLALFSVAALYFTQQDDRRLRRWGPVCGLVAQPFWMWTALAAQQYGALFVACLYTCVWLNGLRNFWWRNK